MKLLLTFGLLAAVSARTYTCSLNGDPHITDFGGKHFNHYQMGKFTALQAGNVKVETIQGRSTTWGAAAVIQGLEVTVGTKKYTVGVNQQTCATTGDLKSTFKSGAVEVRWEKSCRSRVGDRHFNVRVFFTGDSLRGVSGICHSRQARDPLTKKKVEAEAKKRCGNDWRNTLKVVAKNCANRGRSVGCQLDQVKVVCARRADLLKRAERAAALSKQLRNSARQHEGKAASARKQAASAEKRAAEHSRAHRSASSSASSHSRQARVHSSAAAAHERAAAAAMKRYAQAHGNKAAALRSAAKHAAAAARAARDQAAAVRSSKSHQKNAANNRRVAAVHGKAATKAHASYQKHMAEAKRHRKQAAAYQAKIDKFCSAWKRLARKHQDAVFSHLKAAAKAFDSLRSSKKYQKFYNDKAAQLSRAAAQASAAALRHQRSGRTSTNNKKKAEAQARAHAKAAAAALKAAAAARKAAASSRSKSSHHSRMARHFQSIANRHASLSRRAQADAAKARSAANSHSSRARNDHRSADYHARSAANDRKAAAALGF